MTYLRQMTASAGVVLSAGAHETAIVATASTDTLQFEWRRGYPITRLTVYSTTNLRYSPVQSDLPPSATIRYAGTLDALDIDAFADWLYATFKARRAGLIARMHGSEKELLAATTVNNLRQGSVSMWLALTSDAPFIAARPNPLHPATADVILDLTALTNVSVGPRQKQADDFLVLLDLCLSDYGAMLHEYGDAAEETFDALVGYILAIPDMDRGKPVLFMAQGETSM